MVVVCRLPADHIDLAADGGTADLVHGLRQRRLRAPSAGAGLVRMPRHAKHGDDRRREPDAVPPHAHA